MKEGELREILEQSGVDPTRSEGPMRVLVSLRVPVPDQALLAHLAQIGLVVDRVIGHTLLGSIDASKMSELRCAPHVAEVEPSVTLGYHNLG